MNGNNRNKAFVKVDHDALAAQVVAAAGNRTLKGLARDCGLPTSTLTRIVNKEYKGPSQPRVLQAIADNAAPGSGVTMETLMQANGLLSVPTSQRELEATGYYDKFGSIIINELQARGAAVRYQNVKYPLNKVRTFNPDILISTDAAGANGSVWAFEIVEPLCTDPAGNYGGSARPLRTRLGVLMTQVLRVIGNFLIVSMNLPEQPQPMRFSIATAEPAVYSRIVNDFGDTRVSTDISIILANLATRKIIDEYVLPKCDGQKADGYFVAVKPVEDGDTERETNDQ